MLKVGGNTVLTMLGVVLDTKHAAKETNVRYLEARDAHACGTMFAELSPDLKKI